MTGTAIYNPGGVRGAPKPRVLIVEDEPSLREFLCELLEPHFAVEAASDGELAWRAVQRAVPALLLTDLQMPNLDGLGLIRRVRAQTLLAALPIILLTACNDEELPALSLATGANDILLKPFHCAELLACLLAAVATSSGAQPPSCRWKKRRASLRLRSLVQTKARVAHGSARF